MLLIMCYAVYCVYPALAVDWPLRQFRNIFISLTYTAVMFGIIYFISRILCEGHRGKFYLGNAVLGGCFVWDRMDAAHRFLPPPCTGTNIKPNVRFCRGV